MKQTSNTALVMVTAPDLKTGRLLAKAVLHGRLAACANIIPKIESLYWWDEKLETASEVLILFKTTRARLEQLEKVVLATHPYDTPEIMVVPFNGGTPRYLDWLSHSVRPVRSGRVE
jgi:periplasmic divalent cation tolerance protein